MSKLIALLCAASMTIGAGASLAFAAETETKPAAEAAATETATAAATETAATEAAATEAADATAAPDSTAAADATAAPDSTEAADATAAPDSIAAADATAAPESTEAAATEAPSEEAAEAPAEEATEAPVVNPFEDCKGEWFEDAVTYVYSNGLIKGYDAVTFGPQDNVTRDQLAVILYRLNSTEEVVTEGENWAEGAEKWVSETGIMSEFIGEEFGGSENLTREQIISTMYKAYKLTNEAADASAQDMSGFADAETITDYAAEAVKWAVMSGIIEGNDDKQINPADNVTRAETSAILQRYLTKLTFAADAEDETEPEASEAPAEPEASTEPEATEAPAATAEPAADETEEVTAEPVEEVAE